MGGGDLAAIVAKLGGWWGAIMTVLVAGYPVYAQWRKSRADEGSDLLARWKEMEAKREAEVLRREAEVAQQKQEVAEIRSEVRQEREQRKKVERELDAAADEIRSLKKQIGAQDELISGLKREITAMSVAAQRARIGEPDGPDADAIEEMVGRLHEIPRIVPKARK